jgi:membrane protein DedA with SNARE-associated domain
VHAFISVIIQWYFGVLITVGLPGVVVLMAMESTIFPVPSELVVPPAAFVLGFKTGNVDMVQVVLVVLAGTVGSYVGSAATYWISLWVGRPIIVRYGKYFLIPEKKLKMAEEWVGRYGSGGIFFARLLPVVRHLISIPAGITKMPFRSFSLMTAVGSGLWCTVLAIFGVVMSDAMRVVRDSTTHEYTPELRHAFHNLTYALVAMVFVLGVLYVVVVKRRSPAPAVDKTPAA